VACIVKDTVLIEEPPVLSMSIIVLDDSNNTCSGTATAVVTGGTPPYSYQWNDPASQTGQTATALCAGTYICTVSDSNNCSVFDSATVVDFIHLIINSNITHVNCYGAKNGAVNITVSGGRKPYSYTWSNADTSRDLIGVGAGMYYLTVLDFNGILAEDSFLINQPSQIIISDTVKNEGCEGDKDGAITLGVSGGFPPYSYNWSNGSTSKNISNIGAGKYIVIVSDSVGCSVVSDSIDVSGFPSPKPGISPSENRTICKGESMEVMVLENFNTYEWSNGDLTKSIFVTKTGSYFATVTDNNNCRGNTDTVQISVITNPAQRVNFDTLYYYCRDSAYLEFDAGFYKGAEYLWYPTGDTSYKLKVKEPGTYVITIKIDQCTGSDTFDVQELCYPIVHIPNVFTPGTDGVNDEFFCTSIYTEDFELRVFNKWGALLYEGVAKVDENIVWNGEIQKKATGTMLYSLAQELKWDGMYKEEIVPAGTYIYVIKYSNIVYGSFMKSGIIQVLR
jgi:hypothetical protein